MIHKQTLKKLFQYMVAALIVCPLFFLSMNEKDGALLSLKVVPAFFVGVVLLMLLCKIIERALRKPALFICSRVSMFLERLFRRPIAIIKKMSIVIFWLFVVIASIVAVIFAFSSASSFVDEKPLQFISIMLVVIAFLLANKKGSEHF